MLLDTIHSRQDLLDIPEDQLGTLCGEIRQFLVQNVSRTGGHLASNLGIVETTVAIHRVFDTSRDRLVFDVGHQCYTHKLLTGFQRCIRCAWYGQSAHNGRGGLSCAGSDGRRRADRRPCL